MVLGVLFSICLHYLPPVNHGLSEWSPVTVDQLEGSRLVCQSAQLSLDAPGPEWQWLHLKKARRSHFVALEPGGAKYFVSLKKTPAPPENGEQLTQWFLKHLEPLKTPNAKWRALTYQRLNQFQEPTFRVSIDERLPDGAAQILHVVLSTGAFGFMASTHLPANQSPQQFDNFVASYRYVAPPPELTPASLVWSLLTLLNLVIVAGSATVGKGINAFTGKPVINGAKIGAVLVILLLAGQVPQFWAWIGFHMDPQQGQRLSTIMASGLLPLSFAMFLSRRFAERKRHFYRRF
ncbi:hypothetical protein [Acanthopleuribacter pedis]|uniref:Uncharacterized protein n=1 Tax=Acanthopleuribacter pedis TaxID=442870 RepID=A0A8J7U5A5_9BACT|nr:hypothetical protein [Acanthopleuribacter pedis]MBO1321527.1 hypothetical protein [Acanthopleuribacter pedis]